LTKLQFLKILAPGFFPLIVFIVIDSVWGTTAGLVSAVGIGVAELGISYMRERKIDRFVLIDTALIVGLGGVSLLLRNDLFFKLKPAVIELTFCLILGISAFSSVNILGMMSQRYLQGVSLHADQLHQMRRLSTSLFYLFLAHTFMILYAAFFMSKKAWAFISGGLFYILFALFFLVEMVHRRRARRSERSAMETSDGEWFDIVDADGRVQGRAPRYLCHSGPGRMHPVVHLHVVNAANQIFLQQRALQKEIQPGKWDTAVGGHLHSGETVEAGLRREAIEELSLRDFKVQFLGKYVWETEVETELVFSFIARMERVPRINPEEIAAGKFWKIRKIKENLGKGVFTPNFEYEFRELLAKAWHIGL